MPNPNDSYRLYSDFLTADEHRSLLDWALANEDGFHGSLVDAPQRDALAQVDTQARTSRSLRKLGPLRGLLEERVLGSAQRWIGDLGVRPFESAAVELEMTAYNHGGFFAPHVDQPPGVAQDATGYRHLSAVYYFHAHPKRFTGGELRMYPVRPGGAGLVDVSPEQAKLVVFPSWLPHQVMPVECPSRAFSASRFALNIWVYGRID